MWATIAKIYQEQGEDGLRLALKGAGMPDEVIEQVLAQIKGLGAQ